MSTADDTRLQDQVNAANNPGEAHDCSNCCVDCLWDSRCPDCDHRPGAHHNECTVADCGCDRGWDDFPLGGGDQ